MTEEIVKCRKCGEMHRVESYRELKYIYCPQVNRVLLLVQDEETPDEDKKPSERCDTMPGHWVWD